MHRRPPTKRGREDSVPVSRWDPMALLTGPFDWLRGERTRTRPNVDGVVRRLQQQRQRLIDKQKIERDRMFLEQQSKEDRVYWDKEKIRVIDNADRMLVKRNVPKNSAQRLDLLRTTGSPVLARSFRSDHLKTYHEMFQVDLFDNNRQVYRCPNCGRYATPKQLRHWFNPGYSNDALSSLINLRDFQGGLNTRGNQWFSGALPPESFDGRSVEDRISTTGLMVGPEFDLDLNRPGRDILYFPTENAKPMVFACSRECAEEQIRFNYIRTNKLKKMSNLRTAGMDWPIVIRSPTPFDDPNDTDRIRPPPGSRNPILDTTNLWLQGPVQ